MDAQLSLDWLCFPLSSINVYFWKFKVEMQLKPHTAHFGL